MKPLVYSGHTQMRMKLLKKGKIVAENGGLAPAPILLLLAHSSMGQEIALLRTTLAWRSTDAGAADCCIALTLGSTIAIAKLSDQHNGCANNLNQKDCCDHEIFLWFVLTGRIIDKKSFFG